MFSVLYFVAALMFFFMTMTLLLHTYSKYNYKTSTAHSVVEMTKIVIASLVVGLLWIPLFIILPLLLLAFYLFWHLVCND